jgi:3-hydroxy-3-methylglutaryl CoA synthase
MSDKPNPFLDPDSVEVEPSFNYLKATPDELKTHLNTKLTGKALMTYEAIMLHSPDLKLRKEAADKIMEHSNASSKNVSGQPMAGTQINVQFNESIQKTAKNLLGIAEAAQTLKHVDTETFKDKEE